MAGIELPKDAEGREIPLDTNALYLVKDGLKQNVERFTFELKDAEWSVETNIAIYDTEDFSLTQPDRPDSWGKLEEDLDKCIEDDDSCRYYSTTGICAKCTRPDNDGGGCTTVIFSDIKKRIRKLRGEGDA